MIYKYLYTQERCEIIAPYNPKAGEPHPSQLLKLASTVLRAIQDRIQRRYYIGGGLLEHIVLDSSDRTSLVEFGIIATTEDLRLLVNLISKPKEKDSKSLFLELIDYLDYHKIPKNRLKNLGTEFWYREKPIDFSKDYDSVDDLIDKSG